MTRPASDSIKVVWGSTGTGTITLGAVVPGYVAFPSSLNGQLVSYVIVHTEASERETGYGVYTHSGTTLSRIFVTSPVFGGSKVSFSSGTKHVGVAPLASDIVENRDTVAPGANDDISTGYIAGRSRWLNTATDTLYFCVDDTDGAAVWVQVGGAGGGSVDTSGTPVAGDFARFTDLNTIEGRDASETRSDLGLVIGTNVQAFDADLTTLAAQFTTASTAGSARLAFHEDTDNGSMAITLAGPATVAANAIVTLPSVVGTLLLKEQIASGTITARADDINFAGGADGDVLTVQADGSLAPEAPTAAVVNIDQYEIVARVAAGTGAATGFGGAEITEDATPAAGDMLLGWTAGTTLAKFNVANLPTGGGSTLPIADTTGLVKGSVDATKIWRVEADGFTTTTTRVLTPPNRDWAPTTFGSELTEIADAAAGRTKLGLQALATLSTVANAQIDAGAVTANQMYTGSSTSAAAVAGIVNVDFSTLGGTVDFIIVTDITTLHVDLTTPAARRNVYVYNNTEASVVFDVRDAVDAIISTSVPYRHVARLGWSGSAWVAKSVQSVLGHVHSLSDIEDAGAMASRNLILIADLDTTGTQDSTTVLRGNATFGKVGASQLENTAVTPAAYTNANITVDAQGRLTAAANGSGADAAPTRVTSNAATFVLTDAARLHASVEIFSHQATVVFEVAAAATASSKWHIRPQHDGCTVQVTGDVGSVNGASGGAARLVNGGDAFVMVQSNAGSAPVVKVVGDVIISPTAVNAIKTYDNDDHGQDFELISGVGTQTMPTAASAIDGLYFNIFNTSGGNVTIDGADANVTLATSEVITVKKLATSLWAFGSGGVTVLDAA